MILIHCPYCDQARPEVEFTYGGEAHIARPLDPGALSDEEWERFLYIRRNPRGRHIERWRHIYGCGRFFNAVRNTVTDIFEATYKTGEAAPAAGKTGETAPAAGKTGESPPEMPSAEGGA